MLPFQAQLTPAKAAGTTQAKPLVAKVVVQGKRSSPPLTRWLNCYPLIKSTAKKSCFTFEQ